MSAHPSVRSCSRRTFLAGSATLSALAARDASAGEGRLRVGIVGCGGRGTGAALQALADESVRVVALADLFEDQVESCAEMLARSGPRGVVPAARRHVGRSAWLDLLASPLDVVILAAPPVTRPGHLAAATAAGLHVWCETPAAIDPAGLATVAGALAEARRRRLVVGAGLASRFDTPTVSTVERIREGAIGPVRSIALHHDLNLPWRKVLPAGVSATEERERNWISWQALSGGHFVEHHVHALDRALWILGDDLPLDVEAVLPPDSALAGEPGDVPAGVHVRYRFASGAVVEASCRRSPLAAGGVVETVLGARGRADLVGARVERAGSAPWTAPVIPADERGGMFGAAFAAFLERVRSAGTRSEGTAEGVRLLRATGLAVAGAMAASGRRVDPASLFPRSGTA